MVKIRGPLHSVSASGSVAGNLTFSQRKSGQQARWQKKQKDYVNPARATVRSLYSNAVSAWNSLTEEAKSSWKQAAQGKQMTGYNYFVQDYIMNIVNTGLVAYWKLDIDSLITPNTLIDATGNGNNGTIYGATFTTDRKGQANKAMLFDGINDYVNCGHGDSLNITTDISVSLWVKATGLGAGVTPGIIAKRNDGFGLIWVNQEETHIYSRLYQSNGTSINLNTFPITQNVWNHIVLTANSTDKTAKIYMNGSIKGVASSYDGTIRTGSDNLLIGQQSGSFFKGGIDDVRIYNRALSQAEITNLYQK